ncbi:MAG TPA: PQQ-dependent sugar dehydrogenase [Candidatus Thermoplasmatota archaeon]
MRPDHLPSRGPLAGLLALALAAPLSAQTPAGPSAQTEDGVHESARHDFRVVTVADGFDHPWSIAWLPGGEMLVTERSGRLRIVRDGRLDPEPVAGVPRVWARGQGGLLDVLPHPDFARNGLVYLSFSKPSADDSLATTAVVRGRLDGKRLADVTEIFEAKAWSGAGAHFAGRMAFDREGYLFISVGDRGAAPNLMADHPAQHLDNHQGTIIRLHDDGRVPSDNPFVGRSDALPEIWSWGHRNPQGLAFDPRTGELWSDEHGPRGGDELNVIVRGRNYGWPVVSYGINYDGTLYTSETRREGIEAPRWTWVPSIATSGLMVYTGERFPWWQGSVFVGGLAGAQLARVSFAGERAVSVEELLPGALGRIRDVRQGPDGLIYLAIDDRSGQTMTSVVRLEPVEGRVASPR